MPTSVKMRRVREQLDARRRAVLGHYKTTLALADEDTATREPDTLDSASDQWDARVLESVSESDAALLSNIVAAIRRLDEGRYGLCTTCGDRVDPDRLKAMPEAALCFECAASAEAEKPRWTYSVG